MTYAKLIDGELVFAPNPILVDGNYIGNPPGSVYEAEGYKPVQYTDPPGEPDEGYQWEERWTETEIAILQGWEQVLVPISEEDALVRYANEITGADDPDIISAAETMITKISKED